MTAATLAIVKLVASTHDVVNTRWDIGSLLKSQIRALDMSLYYVVLELHRWTIYSIQYDIIFISNLIRLINTARYNIIILTDVKCRSFVSNMAEVNKPIS